MRRFIGIMLASLVVCAIAACVVPGIAAADGYNYTASWGTRGTGDGQFDGIGGMAIDGSGNVYVSDMGNKRIEKFSASGAFLAQWGTLDSTIDGVAVDRSGNVYAADYWNGRILKFSASGTSLAQFNTAIAGDALGSSPHNIAVDSSGNIWVTDSGDVLLKKFDSNGNYLGALPEGNGPGQLSFPAGVAVDSSDNVYVVDCNNYNIQKFSSSGAYLDGKTTMAAGDTALVYPIEVGVDGAGNMYVADTYSSPLFDTGNIKKFDPGFNLLTRIGLYSGSGAALPGTFCGVSAVAVGHSGTVYIADTTFDRVLEFGPATPAPPAKPTASTTKLTAPSSVKAGKTLTLSGSVSPAGASGSVTITKTHKVGAKWKSAGTAKVTVMNGSFTYSFKPTAKGSWRFVAAYAGSSSYGASKSAIKTVKVK